MPRRRGSVILIVILLFPPIVHAAAETSTYRSGLGAEFTLSLGRVFEETIGVVPSLWWYPVPRIVALGCSFDYLGPTLALSVNAGLNLPLGRFVPFICAGLGASLTRGSNYQYGAGVKFRIWRKSGIIVEYRSYNYHRQDFGSRSSGSMGPAQIDHRSGYIGVGFALWPD